MQKSLLPILFYNFDILNVVNIKNFNYVTTFLSKIEEITTHFSHSEYKLRYQNYFSLHLKEILAL